MESINFHKVTPLMHFHTTAQAKTKLVFTCVIKKLKTGLDLPVSCADAVRISEPGFSPFDNINNARRATFPPT